MDIFETFCEINKFGPSGNENETREAIRRLAEPYADDIRVDALGNLIVHKAGKGPKVMIAAHMDSIGLIATHIEKSGHIRFGAVGGINPYTILAVPFRFANGTRASVHCNGDADMSKLQLTDLFLDIGAADDKEAAKFVKPGDMCVYDLAPVKTETGCIKSPYTDDRICCVAQLLALSLVKKSVNDLYFVFTVQEEVGLRGAKPAAFSIVPDYGLACDVTIADDAPNTKHAGSSHLGKGAAVKVMDRSVICAPELVDTLVQLAEKNKIAYQRDVITGGGTDAGNIHLSREGVKTSGVSVPCRYVHSPQETVSIADVEATAKLLAAFCEVKL